ncbi:MAG: AgmX/PglI C-terminal domain-containing protein [Kofleriaceae bacterium]
MAIGCLAAGCGSAAPPPAPVEGPSRYRTFSADQDEDEDGVELRTSHGVLEPEQVRKAVEPHSHELSGCYIQRVGARRWLGGRVSMKWHLDADGAIREVYIAESDLGAWPVEECLLDIAHRMTFPAPRGGATDFAVPLEFSATGAAVPWDEPRAEAAVGEQLAQLAECSAPPVEVVPAAKPTPRGAKAGRAAKAPPAAPPPLPAVPLEDPRHVVITLYVGERGQPRSVGFATPDPRGFSAGWAECAQRIILAWQLPDPRGSIAKMAVRYRGAP